MPSDRPLHSPVLPPWLLFDVGVGALKTDLLAPFARLLRVDGVLDAPDLCGDQSRVPIK